MNPKNPASSAFVSRWEAVGMSRASWYRRGKPTAKPRPKITQKRMAEAFGVSLRTIQRDRAVALHKAFAEEGPKAEAEDRAINFNKIRTDAASHFADTLCRRETAVLDNLDCLIRLTEMKGDMAAEIEPPGDNDLK
jgi:hypothetical protein